MRETIFLFFWIFGLTMIEPMIAEATVIVPPRAVSWIGLLKLGAVVLVGVGVVSGLIYWVLRKTGRVKHGRGRTKLVTYYFRGLGVLFLLLVLGIALIYLGKYVFGEDSWFYRWQVLSRFCTGKICL